MNTKPTHLIDSECAITPDAFYERLYRAYQTYPQKYESTLKFLEQECVYNIKNIIFNKFANDNSYQFIPLPISKIFGMTINVEPIPFERVLNKAANEIAYIYMIYVENDNLYCQAKLLRLCPLNLSVHLDQNVNGKPSRQKMINELLNYCEGEVINYDNLATWKIEVWYDMMIKEKQYYASRA
jgi:hypothetical protein